jgi:hypothetical protein
MRPPNQARPSRAGGGRRLRLRELAAQHPEIPQDSALADTERGQLYQVDRDDIARLDAADGNRPSDRRQGMPVASRREWCRYRADILDVVEGAAYLDSELRAGIDAHRWRRAGIDREEGIRSGSSSCAVPLCVADAGRDTSTRAWDGEVTLTPP